MSMSDHVQTQGEMPAAPPTISPKQRLLLEFLREHDADCPVCGYNVRALTTPVCPECRHELALAIGAARLRLGWLLAAVAPGFFSGVAAIIMLLPTTGQFIGDGGISAGVIMLIALDLFGWSSLLFAIYIAAKPKRFVARPRAQQRTMAILIWIVHLVALVFFFFLARIMLN